MYTCPRPLWVGLLPAALLAAGLRAADYQTEGVVKSLPIFTPQVLARNTHPLAWTPAAFPDFDAWRGQARAKVMSCLLAPPPPAPWDVTVLAEEDRGHYVARKIAFNLTGDSRVLAYLTIPKGAGPFPAVLLFHDHGAKFDIGKEKVIRPFGLAADKMESARKWADENYGGRFIGDVLACRGYVCFATDALNWSDRGGGGYDGQQAIASNLLHLGMSLAGLMAWEDLREAEFLAQQPEVDPRRIAAMGWSMGAYRAWQAAALSDHVAAAVADCWMATDAELMQPGNNQTRGSSSYNMVHPGLLADLDFPDIASIACPKPVLFFNGRQDKLFPVPGVEAAYAKMRGVWSAQGADAKLVTKLWDTKHTFNVPMQDEAFAWLDRVLAKPAATSAGPAGSLPGLVGAIFYDPELKRPSAQVTVTHLDDHNPDYPGDGDWGLRLQGRLTSPVTGKVALRFETSQQVRLWLDGKLVIDAGPAGGTVVVDAIAGHPLPIKLEYAQQRPPPHWKLFWQLPGGAAEPVPATALSHDHSDLAAVEALGVKTAQETILRVANPNPTRLATLSVWRSSEQILIGADIPSVPGFRCDSWSYEGGMEFAACRDLGDGRLELRHRLTASPGVDVVTIVTPAFDSVEFLAHLEREDGKRDPLPEKVVAPNLCWQVKGSSAFASRPGPYPRFVERCFIFTEKGRVFLNQTVRRKIPVQPADDPRNNPPWVQIYGPDDRPPMRAGPDAWADFSPDRFTLPITGVVSRDRRYLAAIAMGSADTLCQAWHDCMHINGQWTGTGLRSWRLKIYAMENDPAKLRSAFARDFLASAKQ